MADIDSSKKSLADKRKLEEENIQEGTENKNPKDEIPKNVS